MKKHIVAVIPARMAASRFPGKPLANILGLPMIEHVRRRVLLSQLVEEVFVATCDQEIMETVQHFGGKVVMTSQKHVRCTDRVEEAAKNIVADIIVLVQGDEPLFVPEVIGKLINPFLLDSSVSCTNLLSLIKDGNDLVNIDIVKAVVNKIQNVMYYSRSPIPYVRVDNDPVCYRQTGVSAFTRTFLSQFVNLSPTKLENTESIDFLRILEHGCNIRGVIVSQETFGVDREDDIEIIENMIRTDPMQKKYYDKIVDL
ncbi:MAG: 3-deoxy-manno-octulosonate cytidylyltransferase [Candidatus Scalindua sp.]